MNLGVRAHDFGKLPAEELARQIAAHRLNCIQLAPIKAIADCHADHEGFDPAWAADVRDTFRVHGIHVSVLGCYINLGDQDEATRRPQLERFKAHLRSARHFGCRLVGTETGSLNSDFSRHPDNDGEVAFNIVLESVRELVDVAEENDVLVGIEAVERYVISSPERLHRLIEEVDSPNLAVIYDPVNLLAASNFTQADAILDSAHALLREFIRVVHAKDFVVEDGVFRELPAGRGRLDYPALARWLQANLPNADVLLENTHPSTIGQTAAFVREVWPRAGT